MPVKSEQDNCSFESNHGPGPEYGRSESQSRGGLLANRSARPAERSVVSGDPVDQTCGIQQRCCFIEQLLGVESDFKSLLMKARSGAGIGCAPYSRGLIKPVPDLS